jgi:hypothetical protein
VNLNPGTADTGDYITMTTRSYLINDSNLSLRQQALAVVSKVGTYAGTTQWNLELTAAYYDLTNTLLHSGTVATIYDNTTWTSMAGTTTTGGTAISASAHYVDLQFKLLATAPVTSATSVTIKSCLLQTSSGGGGGGQSFLITETFTTSGTWTRPTGVDYLVAVIGVGGGGGGASGKYEITRTSATPLVKEGGGGGGGSRYLCVQNLYVGDVASVSVGIGAGGVGGSGDSLTKVAGSTNTPSGGGSAGAAGGTTTFGTYFSIPGGGGAAAAPSTDGGTAGGTVTCSIYGVIQLTSVTGGDGTGGSASIPQPATFSALPYTTEPSGTASAGVAGTTAGGSGTAHTGTGGAAGSAWYSGGGGGGGRTSSLSARNGGNASAGGGGGGGAAARSIVGTATITATAGSGGAGATGSGGGGGGGGGAVVYAGTTAVGTTSYRDSTLTVTTGAGGNGGAGAVIVVYVG